MNVEAISILVGAFLPPFIDLINVKIQEPKIRYAVSLGISLLVGLALSFESLDAADVLKSGALVFAAAQTTYKTYWENSVERKTFLEQDE